MAKGSDTIRRYVVKRGGTPDSFYCARCLAPVSTQASSCSSCRTSFAGAGRFDRIQGPAPSAIFAQIFGPALARDDRRRKPVVALAKDLATAA